MKIHIKTFQGLEEILTKEIEELGATDIKTGSRFVECEGNLEFVYRANYCSRTALKILIPVYRFKAKNDTALYDAVYSHDWSLYLNEHQTFAISSTIFSEFFKHSKYTGLRVKDAIVDQFRNKSGRRPSVDPENPDILINVYAYNDEFTISLDSSGESLNKRGYRQEGHQAPLNEVIAAGMIAMSGWTKDRPFLDPMCGTGTLVIEAALKALNIPSQYLRKNFGFRNWENFTPLLWNKVKNEADGQIRKSVVDIRGSDIDPDAIALVKQSIKMLKLRKEIKISVGDFKNQSSKGSANGFIISNPPYGERIGTEVEALYKDMGDWLKKNFDSYQAWILSSNISALKQIGLNPSKKIDLLNGKLECQYCQYEIFQ